MGLFTLVFSMVRRKGLGAVTEDILEYLWNHYKMSTLINKEHFDIQTLLSKYESVRKKNENPIPEHQVKAKYVRFIYYLQVLPPSMRDSNFMVNFHKLAQQWARGE